MDRNIFCLVIGFILFLAAAAFPAQETRECNPDEIFQACDTNKDGIISADEWAALDADKDNTITSEEWDKYRYKSGGNKTKSFQIRFFSVYGNGTMNREEFMQNFRRLQ